MKLGDISDWMDENRYKTGALMIAGLLLLTMAPYPNNPLYAGGWEIQTSIYEVRQNGIIYGSTAGNYPWLTEYWGSSSVRYDTDASDSSELGPGFVDWDWDVIGCADTQIDITNPAHITFDILTQQWVPAADDEVFYQYSKTITYTDSTTGEEITEVYFWDHHVYSFWITVISDPDVLHDGAFSMAEVKGGEGVVSSINPKVLFKVQSWDVGPDSFTLTNDDDSVSTYNAIRSTFWTGVMSASVMDSYAGYVQKTRLDDGGADSSAFIDATTAASGIHASATMSGALNMYYVDNPSLTVDDWTDSDAQSNPDAIQGVPTEVLIEFYGELQPGYTWPLFGSISTSAVMYQYKARVDVLVTGGYQLASGQQPEDPVDPTIIDTGADPLSAFLSLFSGGNIFIGLIIVVVVIYVVFKIIGWMRGGK